MGCGVWGVGCGVEGAYWTSSVLSKFSAPAGVSTSSCAQKLDQSKLTTKVDRLVEDAAWQSHPTLVNMFACERRT